MDYKSLFLSESTSDPFEVVDRQLASGTPLRQAVESIIAAANGALICIGDVDTVLAFGDGGFRLDVAFTPQRLFELSKMDGAIVLSEGCERIICASFHLHPDPNLDTHETGMRHRSAERTSLQTDATVIAISRRRRQTTVFRQGRSTVLESDEILFSKGNQAILALQNAKNNLERLGMRQSLIEMDDLVTVGDVVKLLHRYIHLLRLAAQTEHFIVRLGTSSGILRSQMEEIMSGVADSLILMIRDYAIDTSEAEAVVLAQQLLALDFAESESSLVMKTLGYLSEMADETHLNARGFRVISRFSILDEAAVQRIVDEYGSLSEIVNDFKGGFDHLSDAGIENVRAIAASFRQLTTNL